MAAFLSIRQSNTVLAGAVLTALSGVLALGARPAMARGLEDPRAFQSLADSVMAAEMTRHHIPGGVLVAVRGGEVFCARGYGFADLERKIPVDPERTIFRVASVSKVFTATAAMQLVEQERLDLHADVNRYLKRFQLTPTYPEPVTLFHLLTHTAGFDDRNIDRKARTAAEMESLGAYLARRMPPRILPPGRIICYSNHGMALAGCIVEAVSGQPFDRYMHDHIFAPLGMTRSSFASPVAPSDLALGYGDSDPPRRRPVEYVKTVPASMLTTTGMDVARFAIAHLENGRLGASPILGEAAAEEMHRRQFTQDARLPGIAFGFWERFQNGERALWHDGDGGGFASLLYLLPEQDTGFFIVFNGRGGNEARTAVLAGLLDRYFPDPRPVTPPHPFADAATEARRCAGTYVYNRYGHRGLERIVLVESQIEARAGSAGTLEVLGKRYVAIAPRLFERTDGRSFLGFQADQRGRIAGMFTGESMARAYERVPWYCTARFQLAVVGFCFATFAWTLLAWPMRLIVRLLRRRGPAPGTGLAAELVPVVLSGMNLLFLFGFASYLVASPSPLEFGIPPLFVALLTIPLLSTGFGVALVLLCARQWGHPAASRGSRIQYALVTVAAVVFVAWLAQWNLLGYRY